MKPNDPLGTSLKISTYYLLPTASNLEATLVLSLLREMSHVDQPFYYFSDMLRQLPPRFEPMPLTIQKCSYVALHPVFLKVTIEKRERTEQEK